MLLNLLKYILLAIIQGISEILPISSSGHLIITQNLLGLDISNMSTSIFLHIGSLIAVIVFYFSTLKMLGKNTFNYVFKKEKSENCKKAWHLIIMMLISILPAGILGLIFKSTIEQIFSSTLYIGINLIITAVLLILLTRNKGLKSIDDISYIDALIIGLFQAIGIMPGISRSGITTIGGKVSKLKDEDAINYSFLLFIPVALGTGLLEIIELCTGKLVLTEQEIILNVIGAVISMIVTYLSLKLLLKIIKKGKLYYFSFYCLIVGILILIF
ncbi:MAG: undecaprenyl-diphosphate phosphatase [Erysipelotrichales bacterium]|nr:undecaprenyl-diphosphate phosphatase [Erysipelotrichales bacterium]